MTTYDVEFGPKSAALRWLSSLLWRIEHAFERARAEGRAEDAKLRIFFVSVTFVAAFVTLGVGATRAALFSDAAEAGHAFTATGARADIVDRNGNLLAVDLPYYALFVDSREIWDVEEVRRRLGPLLSPAGRGRLEKALASERRIQVLTSLTPQERTRIADMGLPGVTFEPEVRRNYPLGPTAAHLLGFTDSGGAPLAGAEAALNKDILAAAGAQGAVPLSIDLRVQAALEDELQKAFTEFTPKGAVGLVTDVHTGEILGMASYPTFDPNDPGGASDDAKLNRAAAAVFEMGSTFKTFTVAIGLDTGVANMSSTFDAREPFKLGYRTIDDFHAARKILTLTEVFQHSSNIGTAKLAVGVGTERLSKYYAALGLTKPAKVELKESARPLTPKVWNDDAVASTSFGHGINVSPLALATAMNTLLNGGKLLPLTIRKMDPGVRPSGQRVISEETSKQMLQIMRANVTGGSGGKADAPGLSVGRKTGTGEKYDPAIRRYNHQKQVSSFAAVFPSDGPIEAKRYFVLILLDEPHGTAASGGAATGGWVAAPAAGRVIDRIAPFLGVSRRAETMTFAGDPSLLPEAR